MNALRAMRADIVIRILVLSTGRKIEQFVGILEQGRVRPALKYDVCTKLQNTKTRKQRETHRGSKGVVRD